MKYDSHERRCQLREEKNKLRSEFREKRAAIPEEVKKARDNKINEILSGLVSFRFSDTILIYYPLKDEIDMLPLVNKAFSMGKKVAFPKTGECGIMDFYIIHDLEKDFEPGPFGLTEPKADCEKFEIGKDYGKVLIIIPAFSFDKEGNRLGYGKGYYDRFLDKLEAKTIGICYYDFLSDSLPHGCHDKKVDFIVTEKGVKLIG